MLKAARQPRLRSDRRARRAPRARHVPFIFLIFAYYRGWHFAHHFDKMPIRLSSWHLGRAYTMKGRAPPRLTLPAAITTLRPAGMLIYLPRHDADFCRVIWPTLTRLLPLPAISTRCAGRITAFAPRHARDFASAADGSGKLLTILLDFR